MKKLSILLSTVLVAALVAIAHPYFELAVQYPIVDNFYFIIGLIPAMIGVIAANIKVKILF